jgi:tRNA uridine 5-carboxymethylaminomethyl modification enzyme
MFTSRAEYRLILREDNADLRLSESARQLGLLGEEQWQAFASKREAIEREQQRLKDLWVQPASEAGQALTAYLEKPLSKEARAIDLLRRPELDYARLSGVAGIGPAVADPLVAEQVEIQAKYEGYLNRQQEEIDKARRYEDRKIPDDIEYDQVKGLSNEVRQKLVDHRPATLGQAGRISGVTPAAISLLLVHIKKTGNS